MVRTWHSISGPSGGSGGTLALALLLSVSCSRGEPPAAAMRDALPRDLPNLVEALRQEAGAPGAILGVGRGDQLAVVASGLADREKGTALTPSSPYYLGSIAKTYTAATVLRLAEEGKLFLDDPLARFLPTFPRASEITVRHLLSHTSGLKDFYAYLYSRPERAEMIELVTKRWQQEELIALAGRFGHWFDPGTDWDYSNGGYFLLGVVIEKASGLTLPEAYRHYLYAPLGLEHTAIAEHEAGIPPLPTGYMGPVKSWKHSEMFGELGPTTVLDSSPVEWGAGGVVAPANEAIRFLRGVLVGDLLQAASREAMTTFRSTPELGVPGPNAPAGANANDGYGLGLVRMERAGTTIEGHGGLFTGHTAGLWYLPACDVTVAVYFNRGFVNQRAILDRLLPVVAGPDCQSNGVGPSGRASNPPP